MENAERFLTNLERLSSSTKYYSATGGHDSRRLHFENVDAQSSSYDDAAEQELEHSQYGAGYYDSVEIPLDDFDTALLAESDRGLQQREGQRATLLVEEPVSQFSFTPETSINEISHQHIQSSSSPSGFVSSPVVSALQNRRRNSDRISNNRGVRKLIQKQANRASEVRKSSSDDVTQDFPTIRKSTPIVKGIPLVPTSQLPDQIRSLFKFTLFNAIQSRCFSTAFKSDDNLVVSAPTGSGKTVVMELAICRLMTTCKNVDFKIVYQAPTKSLCAERYRDWQSKYGCHGLACAELTGDSDNSNLRNVQSARIIITTPEKWDCVTRKWHDHHRLMSMVKLFLVDEVHILKEPRGASLEAVVSRMKTAGENVRFVALSATIPNSKDIACWLGRNAHSPSLPAQEEVFEDHFRPVKVQKLVYGFRCNSNDFALDSMLTKCLPEVIQNHGDHKPVMVFCPTRRSSIATAKALSIYWSESCSNQKLWNGPKSSVNVRNADLKEVTMAAVAFHHGGLDASERLAVEKGFLQGNINVICCTSTLAVGVNLPCYLVILKGTVSYSDSGLREYSDLEVMQMVGRAGRPQFETSACAVILTQQAKVTIYEQMVSGQNQLESCLHEHLIEHLNAEISLGTVYDLSSAKRWLQGTFLFQRLQQNPSYYRFREDVDSHIDDDIIGHLCEKDIKMLSDTSLISTEGLFKCTPFGHTMARYYVSFDTIKLFMSLPHSAKISEILTVLSQAAEFHEVRMKAGEKSFYKEMNKGNAIRFPIRVDVALLAHKVSLIIQSQLGNVSLPDSDVHKKHHSQYRIDKTIVFSHGNRLIRCMIDCLLNIEDATAVKNALELGRSLAAQGWDDTASQLRQLEGVGEVSARKLAAAGINSIDALSTAEPHRLELILGKAPPSGRKLLDVVEKFPRLRISVQQLDQKLIKRKGREVKFRAEVAFLNEVPPRFFKRKPIYVCFLSNTSDGQLINFRRFSSKDLQDGKKILLTALVTNSTSNIICHVMCDEIAGTYTYAELKLQSTERPLSTFNHVDEQVLEDLCSTTQFSNAELLDDGIDDMDLLAADPGTPKNDDVHDIDDILQDNHELSASHQLHPDLSRESSKRQSPRNPIETAYHTPFQLKNGRWTCQHDCRQRNKDCKHKCCQVGVIKPKKRPDAHVMRTKIGDRSQSVETVEIGRSSPSTLREAKSKQKSQKEVLGVVTGLISPTESLNMPKSRSKRKLSDLDRGFTLVEMPKSIATTELSKKGVSSNLERAGDTTSRVHSGKAKSIQEQDPSVDVFGTNVGMNERNVSFPDIVMADVGPYPNPMDSGSNEMDKFSPTSLPRFDNESVWKRPSVHKVEIQQANILNTGQKPGWEGVDPWIYGQFHDIVELL